MHELQQTKLCYDILTSPMCSQLKLTVYRSQLLRIPILARSSLGPTTLLKPISCPTSQWPTRLLMKEYKKVINFIIKYFYNRTSGEVQSVTEVDYVFYILRKHYRPLPLRSLAISNPGHRLSHGKVPTDLRASLRVRETKTQVHQPELRLREPAEGIPAAQLRR